MAKGRGGGRRRPALCWAATRTHVRTHAQQRAYTDACIRARMHASVHRAHANQHVQTHTHTYARTRAHAHACTRARARPAGLGTRAHTYTQTPHTVAARAMKDIATMSRRSKRHDSAAIERARRILQPSPGHVQKDLLRRDFAAIESPRFRDFAAIWPGPWQASESDNGASRRPLPPPPPVHPGRTGHNLARTT